MARAAAFIAVALRAAVADQASFDCPMRELALNFAAAYNPALTAAHLQDIADALDGASEKTPGCNVTVPPALLSERAGPRFRPFPLPAASAGTFYVSPSGSDSAAGSVSAPFKTLPRALAATRSSGGGGSIVLRGGTHFLSAPLVLDGRDSGLTMQAYSGEAAWLSRGVPLAGLTWTSLNPHPANASSWAGPFVGQNAVYGCVPGSSCVLLGTTPDAAACQALCATRADCDVYTWHDPTQSGFANDCIMRLPNDNTWAPTPQEGHTSGYRIVTPNIWVADVSSLSATLPLIAGLRSPDGSRMIRARYPNANPELGFGPTLRATSWTKTSVPIAPAVEVNPITPNRTSSYSFIYYQGGIGGICSVPGFGFSETPGSSYWCGSKTEGGGGFTWRTPVGLTTSNATLPHLPYANPQDAVVQAWHPARWASRMYRLDASGFAYDAATGDATLQFAEGGYQDARGSDDAGDWYVENVLEELDAPGEWFHDRAAGKLYVFVNATAGTPPPNDGSIIAIPDGAVGLINVSATQAAPVSGLSFLGLGFRDTANVFFAPHSIPSGGDWALSRLAALQLEGTEGALVDSCVFERLDNTALLISGYNRNAHITRNTFKWIGDSAIISWGRTTGDPSGADGWDGTDGNQPRYNLIDYNFASEVGIWEKQRFVWAKTSDTFMHANVGFNGPRAGINFNDGFGGNSTLLHNLAFNFCRESGDHGPFNSWDRQLFVTYKGLATTGYYTDWNHITQNFFIANYESSQSVDNDDGTAYYNTSLNLMMYGGDGMKSDFGGHDNVHHNNIYGYMGAGFGICPQLKGHPDSFYSNHVVQRGDGNYGGGQACKTTASEDATVVHDNTIYTPTGKVTECGMALAAWQAQGNDPGTVALPTPDDATLLALAKAMLGL